MRLPVRVVLVLLVLFLMTLFLIEYKEYHFRHLVSRGISTRTLCKSKRGHARVWCYPTNNNMPKPRLVVRRQKVVVVMAYLRGGSSLVGRLMSMNPGVFYWYEPLSDIYNAFSMARLMTLTLHVIYNRDGTPRRITPLELNYIKQYLWKIVSCDFARFPVEMLGSWTSMESPVLKKTYRQCFIDRLKKALPGKAFKQNSPVEDGCQMKIQATCPLYVNESLDRNCHIFMDTVHLLQSNSSMFINSSAAGVVQNYVQCLKPYISATHKCLHLLQSPCQTSNIKAFKITRLRLATLEHLLLNDVTRNDVDVYVIHQLRDPRGIIASRRKDHRLTKKDLGAEARLLCHKMLEDIRARERLSRTYPGVFKVVRYEELADRPLGVAQEVYEHVDELLPVEVKEWLRAATQSDKDGGPFSETRRNSSATARAWMKALSDREKREITAQCRPLLTKAGYKP